MNFSASFLRRRVLVLGSLISIAALTLVVGWGHAFDNGNPFTLQHLSIALYLVAAIIVSYYFPINARLHTKIQMTTIVLYLAALLLPPVLAATIVGIGILIAEILVSSTRKNNAADIAMQTARNILMIQGIAMVAHLSSASGSVQVLFLMGIALLLFACDLLTFSLQLFFLFGDHPKYVLIESVREVGLAESAQYLLGVLGVLAIMQNPLALLLLIVPAAIFYIAYKSLKEIHNDTHHLLVAMADAVDLRDSYTGGHSRRVTDYSAQLLQQLGLHGLEVDLILSAARVHDIGKIGIPDSVLQKPGPLTPEERTIMESHSARGAELLERYPDFSRGMAIVRHHHESWDGTGYPDGLKGETIPFGARVIAVADTFDAMTSDRPYRKGMPVEKAVAILHQGRGQQWEASLVDAFVQSLNHSGLAEVPQEQLSQSVAV